MDHEKQTIKPYETIIFERIGHTALLTLNRPEHLNSYNEQMHEDLRDAWLEVNRNPEIWTVVVQGTGRAFCTGADMKEASKGVASGGLGPKRWNTGSDSINLFSKTSIERVMNIGLPRHVDGYPSKPVIAAIHGLCAGDGMGWVYRTDFAICSEDATFFDPHVNVSVTPPGIHWLSKIEPRGAAFATLFMGKDRRLDAWSAFELGMVTQVVKREDLLETALDIAESIHRRHAPLAAQALKAHFSSTSALTYDEALALSHGYDHQIRFYTDDFVEAQAAHRDGRPPQFRAQ